MNRASVIGLITVWLGGLLQLFVLFVEEYDALLPCMAVSGLGLLLFHYARGHPWTVLVMSALTALLPIFGPLLGLRFRPPGAGAPAWRPGRWLRGFALFALAYAGLAIVAMGAFGFVHFPAPARAAFWSSAEMELLSLRPYHGRPDFYGSEILGSITVRGFEKVALLGALALGVSTNPGAVAMCFSPRHALRVTHEGTRYALEICFECHHMLVHFGERRPALSTTSPLPGPLFNAMLSRRGIELSPE